MIRGKKAKDYAYRFNDCKQLAKDDKEKAKNNADSMKLFALGERLVGNCPEDP